MSTCTCDLPKIASLEAHIQRLAEDNATLVAFLDGAVAELEKRQSTAGFRSANALDGQSAASFSGEGIGYMRAATYLRQELEKHKDRDGRFKKMSDECMDVIESIADAQGKTIERQKLEIEAARKLLGDLHGEHESGQEDCTLCNFIKGTL